LKDVKALFNFLKTMSLKHIRVKVFETIWNCKENHENIVSKECILNENKEFVGW